MTQSVAVPVALLQQRGLLPSAKLVWAALRLHAQTSPLRLARLQAATGLARPTVRKALRQLAGAGWTTATTTPATPHKSAMVNLPRALLPNLRVGAPGRLLYGLLQATAGFHSRNGKFTYRQLAELAGFCRNTIKRGVQELVRA